MQRAQTAFLRVAVDYVARIASRTLHPHFDPVRSTQSEVSLYDGPGKVIHFFEHLSFAIVKVSLPMPRRVSAATCRAKNEELRVGRPLGFLNVTAVLAIRRLEILCCQDAAVHILNLDLRFIE